MIFQTQPTQTQGGKLHVIKDRKKNPLFRGDLEVCYSSPSYSGTLLLNKNKPLIFRSGATEKDI